MKDLRWQVSVGIILVMLSAILYLIHFSIFHDAEHIWIYLLGDIAFIPIEILLVTVIVHQMLDRREVRQKLEKMNMVIGTFFSVVGTEVLAYLSDHDPGISSIKPALIVAPDWGKDQFVSAFRQVETYRPQTDIQHADLAALKAFLGRNEEFLIRLLENPTMLEHEDFSRLLMALFHLDEELQKRKDLSLLPEADISHLNGDIGRVYVLLIRQWLDYMRYLKGNYPYLFSLAMRTNPFDEHATVIVK